MPGPTISPGLPVQLIWSLSLAWIPINKAFARVQQKVVQPLKLLVEAIAASQKTLSWDTGKNLGFATEFMKVKC